MTSNASCFSLTSQELHRLSLVHRWGNLSKEMLVHISFLFWGFIAIYHVIEFFINHVIKSIQSHCESVFPLAIFPAVLFNHFQVILSLFSSVLHPCRVVSHVPPSTGFIVHLNLDQILEQLRQLPKQRSLTESEVFLL